MLKLILDRQIIKKINKMGNNLISNPQHKFRSRSKYWQIEKQSNSYSWTDNESQEKWSSSWKDITHQNIYYRSEYGKFNVFRNEIAGQQVERHRIVLKDKKDYEKWREVVEWRNNCQQLVGVEHFEIQNSAEVCVSQFQVNLFVERIPLRLSDLTDIPYPENIYFLLSVVKGFKYIFSHPFLLKTFPITESMICVNRDGQVKVWLNSNLAEEMPVDSKQGAHITQEDLLKGLIDLIQQNTDQRDYPYSFRQYLNDKKFFINGDFNILIQQIYSYAKDMKVTIPNFSSSVRDILTKDLFHNAKFQTEHSTNKIYFQDQSQQIKKENSFSAINQVDVKNQHQNQLVSSKDHSNHYFFPQQQQYAINPPARNQNIPSHPTNLTLPLLNFQNQLQESLSNKKHNARFSNRQIHHKNPLINSKVPLQSYTDRPIFCNKISNNVIQFQRPDINRNNFQMGNNFNSEYKNTSEITGSNRHNFQNPQPLQGFKMVRRQIIHLPAFHGPVQNQTNFIPQVPYSFSIIPEHHQYQSIQPNLTFNKQNQQIQHGQMQGPMNSNSLIYVKPQIIQKNTSQNLVQTVRPEQLSNPMKIERISRQSSMKGFSQQYSRENLSKTHSFKKNLVKSQHSEPQNTGRVFGLKYFTKKDSEETLDPEIAADLMKFLNRTLQK